MEPASPCHRTPSTPNILTYGAEMSHRAVEAAASRPEVAHLAPLLRQLCARMGDSKEARTLVHEDSCIEGSLSTQLMLHKQRL